MNKLKYIPAGLVFCLIITLSWYGRIVQTALRNLLGLNGLIFLVCSVAVTFILISVKIFRIKEGPTRLLLVLYPIGIYILRANPEEAVHLMEYGAFALSLRVVFSNQLSERKTFLLSTLGAIILGILDECLQGINPVRVFDLRDILINSIGAAVTSALFVNRSRD